MRQAVWLCVLPLMVVAVVLGGCGADNSGNEGAAPPFWHEPAPFMSFVAEITKGSNAIDRLALWGTRLELNPQATVVALPAGTTEPVALATVPMDDGWISVGPVPLQPGLNLIEVDAPSGYALTIHTVPPDQDPFPRMPWPPIMPPTTPPIAYGVPRSRGPSRGGFKTQGSDPIFACCMGKNSGLTPLSEGFETTSGDRETAIREAGVGTLRVGFEMLADGTIIAPHEVWMFLREDATTRRLGTYKLAPGDWFRAELHDSSGGVTIGERRADGRRFAVIRDPVGGLSDPPLWGPDCVLALYFVRNHDLLPRY